MTSSAPAPDVERGNLRFGVLGPLSVMRGAEPIVLGSGKQRLLLAALVLHPNEIVTSAELTELIWDDDPPLSAPANLRTYVRGLRKVLGPARIPVASGGYLLSVEQGERDLDRFDDATARARTARSDGDHDKAASYLADALALSRSSPPLAELPQTPGLGRLTRPLEERLLLAEEEYAEALLVVGATSEVIVRLRTVVAQSPLRQRAWGTLMLALHRSGDVAGALAAYREAQRALAEQMGLDPSAELSRLHDGILQQDPALFDDPSQRPAVTTTSASPVAKTEPERAIRPEQLPAAPHSFVGREHQLDQIDRFLAERTDAVGVSNVIAVTGSPGMGKTSLGLHWAHEAADRFPGGRLYIDLRGCDDGDAVRPEDALLELLESLGVTQDRIPSTLGARSALFRSILADLPALVFLDSAENADQVRPLLPGAGPAVTLVTSRNSLGAFVATADAHHIALGELTDDEARTLWAERLGAERIAAEPAAAATIGRTAGNLPLAICMAAARISAHPLSKLASFAAEIDANSGDADDADVLFDGEMRAVFSWSYNALGPESARLFRLLGMHPGPDFTADAAAALAGERRSRVTRMLRELSRLQLVTETQPFRWGMHDLLRQYAADLATSSHPAAELFLARQRLNDHYLHIAYPAARLMQPQWIAIEPLTPVAGRPPIDGLADHDDAIAWFESERAVLVNVARDAGRTGHDRYSWQIAWALTTYLAPHGLWHEQRDVQTLALEAATRVDDLIGQATARRMLALPLARLGDVAAATENIERAIAIYTETGDRAGLAQSHHIMSEMCGLRGYEDDALRHARAALDLHEQLGDASRAARSRNALGWLIALTGDYETAIEHCSIALEYQENGGDPNGQAATLDSIGYCKAGLGKHGEAVEHYEQALRVWRESADHYHESESLLHLGDSHLALGDPAAAATAWQRAAEIHEPHSAQVAERIARLEGTYAAPDEPADRSKS